MLHQKIDATAGLDGTDIAAVWPVSAQIAPVPIPEIQAPQPEFRPTPAAPDVPSSVGVTIFLSYAAFIAALFLATAGSTYSIFMITISALFVVMFFAVPRIFFKVEPKAGKSTDFDQFMWSGLETLTGHTSGKAALVQMMIVPVLLTLGISAMGIAASILM